MKKKVMFKSRRIAFSIVMLIVLVTLPITPPLIDGLTKAADSSELVVINFDDLEASGPGTPATVTVTAQYADRGVTFNSPVALDYSKGLPIPGFARSPNIAIEQCYSEEFCAKPIEMTFTRAQRRVKVWVGLRGPFNAERTVLLRGFDSSGAEVVNTTVKFPASSSSQPVRTPLEVISSSVNLVRATVSFSPTTLFMNGLAVDDVEFDRSGPPFNVCLQDDFGGDTLQFNTFTGNYKYTRCSDGLMLSGKGKISRIGCEVRLEDDSRVSASIGECTVSIPQGNATIRITPLGPTCSIKDSNRFNNSCICPLPRCFDPPSITSVGLIPTAQINANNFYRGPSSPSGATPPDDGVPPGSPIATGDHPFGGLTSIHGIVNLDAFQYKVEHGPSRDGPWTPITKTIEDQETIRISGLPDIRIPRPRAPADLVGGWYNIKGITGIHDFKTYLTDWDTTDVTDGLYYLKLTVRDTALRECNSDVVPVIIDNTPPSKPKVTLKLSDGTDIGCCGMVRSGPGASLIITLEAMDMNFSQLTVTLEGSCDLTSALHTKSYNGVITDRGYPSSTEITVSLAGIPPCCYLVRVQISDRAIVSNNYSFHHTDQTFKAINIVP
ncbi:MAG TPA: hypothetical protein VJ810_40590 [Blastocatellia bacterium]|nr:hypothetical protein [Blastocatellia bacterium]